VKVNVDIQAPRNIQVASSGGVASARQDVEINQQGGRGGGDDQQHG
jgi:hypothetical protein